MCASMEATGMTCVPPCAHAHMHSGARGKSTKIKLWRDVAVAGAAAERR